MKKLAAAWAALLAAAGMSFGEPPTSAPPDPWDAAVARLLLELDAPEYTERMKAAERAMRLPGQALPAVQRAVARGVGGPDALAALKAAVPMIKLAGAREAVTKRQLEHQAWMVQTLGDAYRAAGHTSPKWDALVAAAHREGEAPPGADEAPRNRKALAAYEAARAAGCDDPFILWACALYKSAVARADGEKAAGKAARLATYKAALASPYPALVKLWVAGTTADLLAEPVNGSSAVPQANREELSRVVSQALDALPEALRSYPVHAGGPEMFTLDLYGVMTRAQRPADAQERILAAIRKVGEDSYLADLIEAASCLGAPPAGANADNAAWAVAYRRNKAREALQRAIRKEPLCWRAACELITLAPDRVTMESWYATALGILPDALRARENKFQWLMRSGDNGEAEALAFAREVAAQGERGGRAALILMDYHFAMANRLPAAQRESYFTDAQVWQDVRDVYGCLLRQNPDNAFDRSRYAMLACWAQQWAAANALFEKLGDKLDGEAFNGDEQARYWRRKAARMVIKDE